jgi:2,4-dienoyl-CoA reductase-like NADH-dependent reductase (Old Yellow Enzyme family)
MTRKPVARRFPTSDTVDPKVLAQELHLKTSGRTAKNRFFKAAMSELQASYSKDSLKGIGIPSEGLIRLYEKWGHGGFGMIVTGNIIIGKFENSRLLNLNFQIICTWKELAIWK